MVTQLSLHWVSFLNFLAICESFHSSYANSNATSSPKISLLLSCSDSLSALWSLKISFKTILTEVSAGYTLRTASDMPMTTESTGKSCSLNPFEFHHYYFHKYPRLSLFIPIFPALGFFTNLVFNFDPSSFVFWNTKILNPVWYWLLWVDLETQWDKILPEFHASDSRKKILCFFSSLGSSDPVR